MPPLSPSSPLLRPRRCCGGFLARGRFGLSSSRAIEDGQSRRVSPAASGRTLLLAPPRLDSCFSGSRGEVNQIAPLHGGSHAQEAPQSAANLGIPNASHSPADQVSEGMVDGCRGSGRRAPVAWDGDNQQGREGLRTTLSVPAIVQDSGIFATPHCCFFSPGSPSATTPDFLGTSGRLPNLMICRSTPGGSGKQPV